MKRLRSDMSSSGPQGAGTADPALIKRLDELILLNRLSLLGEERILNFVHNDEEIRLHIPWADRDFIQRSILSTGTFFEAAKLQALHSANLINQNAIIYDVGANIGNHTVYFGTTFRPAAQIAIEPQRQVGKVLRRNLALNGLEQVKVIDCLLGRTEGRGEVANYVHRNLGATSFREATDGAVEMRTLDSILQAETQGRVDFVKMDVEGMHLDVLAGATEMLRTARPIIWIELRKKMDEHAEGARFMKENGYSQTHVLGPSDFIFQPD